MTAPRRRPLFAFDEAWLTSWEHVTTPIIVIAAVLPIVAVGDLSYVWVLWGTWAVFAIDFGVHVAVERRFVRSYRGWIYLAIIVVTFPWFYVVPRAEWTHLSFVIRIAYMGRLVLAASMSVKGIRLLIERLGNTVLYALGAILICSLVVYNVEDGQNGFDSFGDTLWWAIVTITTVGYGDLVPEKLIGRLAAAALMITGVAILGALAGSLAAFFGMGGQETESEPDRRESVSLDERVDELTGRICELTDKIDGMAADGCRMSISTGPSDVVVDEGAENRKRHGTRSED